MRDASLAGASPARRPVEILTIVQQLAPLTPNGGASCAVAPTEMPELANTVANAIAIALTTYVIHVTRRLDKEVSHGGE